MNDPRRPSQPASASVQEASLLRWVEACQVVVAAAGAFAVLIGVMLLSRGRRIEGLIILVFGVAAAVTTKVVISYIAWRVQAASERDAPRSAERFTAG